MAIEVGNVFEGRVTGVKPFGAFVALPEGRVGMVHISEVSNEYVQDINTVLHDGDTVKVQVIQVAPDGKIALSIKRTQPAPERGPRQQHGERTAGGNDRRPAPRPKREEKPRVWQPKPAAPQGDMSFEDMMARYKTRSEEKIADLKRVTENHRGGYSRRRG